MQACIMHEEKKIVYERSKGIKENKKQKQKGKIKNRLGTDYLIQDVLITRRAYKGHKFNAPLSV